jgi:hypothetical protein
MLLRVRVTLQLTVSQSVCLGVEPRPGLMTRYLFLIEKLQSCPNGAPSLMRGRVDYMLLSLSLSLMLRPTVNRPVCLGIKHPSGAYDQIFLPFGIWNTSDSYVLDSVGRPLWRGDGSVFCMCRWHLLAQSFSGPGPLGLATVFYCLRSETSLFVASYDSQGHGGDSEMNSSL